MRSGVPAFLILDLILLFDSQSRTCKIEARVASAYRVSYYIRIAFLPQTSSVESPSDSTKVHSIAIKQLSASRRTMRFDGPWSAAH